MQSTALVSAYRLSNLHRGVLGRAVPGYLEWCHWVLSGAASGGVGILSDFDMSNRHFLLCYNWVKWSRKNSPKCGWHHSWVGILDGIKRKKLKWAEFTSLGFLGVDAMRSLALNLFHHHFSTATNCSPKLWAPTLKLLLQYLPQQWGKVKNAGSLVAWFLKPRPFAKAPCLFSPQMVYTHSVLWLLSAKGISNGALHPPRLGQIRAGG